MSAEPHDAHDFADALGDVDVERRRSHREPIVAIGRLLPLEASDEPRPIQVLVTDVSLHGCDFRSAALPRDGAFYRIDIHVGPLALTSRLRVIRLHHRADGTYAAGAEFV